MGGLVLAEVRKERMTGDFNLKLVSICCDSKLIVSDFTRSNGFLWGHSQAVSQSGRFCDFRGVKMAIFLVRIRTFH